MRGRDSEKDRHKPNDAVQPSCDGMVATGGDKPTGGLQRRPRQRDEKYLRLVRLLPCLRCGKDPCGEAAHLRMTAVGKSNPGVGAKPSDCWALPLDHRCHMVSHTRGESVFWDGMGINPITLAKELYRLRDNLDAMRARVWAHLDKSPWL